MVLTSSQIMVMLLICGPSHSRSLVLRNTEGILECKGVGRVGRVKITQRKER